MEYLYSIHDKAADTWSPPFAASNDTVAQRSFTHFCSKLAPFETPDFALYKVGTFETPNCKFTQLPVFEEIQPRPFIGGNDNVE